MAELGQFALQLALFLSGYAIFVDLLGNWRNKTELIDSGRNATIACYACLTVAMTTLLILLVRSDFIITYVAENTSKDLPLPYKISALWAGAAGSLLLWLWLQIGFVLIVFCKATQRAFSTNARAVANMVSAFFLLILLLDKNPFDSSTIAPADGSGLNPLLQHPAMALHPPILFMGYAAFIIPFAWAFASLTWDSAQGTCPFFKQARNWTLSAWLFLTIGIALGAWWAYEELGWGGYWAWDPVENASLLPWLTATALIHCYRIYNDRSSIAVWTIVLSLVTFSLCIFGRFVTKYLGALLASVHAFAERGLGILYLVLLILIWVLAVILMWRKYHKKKFTPISKAKSGIKFIVLNNWLMLLLTFLIFAGTLFPFFSGLFSDSKISLKAEYFTKITAPVGMLLILLIAMCPHLLRYGINKSWRTIGGLLAVVTALTIWLVSHKIAIAYFILCIFAAINLIADFLNRYLNSRRVKKKEPGSRWNPRWYGARFVHIGVILVFVGIAGSGGYGTEEQAALKPNEKISVAGFDIIYEGLRADHGSNYVAVMADVSVHKNEKLIAKLNPSQAYYTRPDTRTSEVDIKRTLSYDLYIALTEVDRATELINIKVLVKPLINWIWIGSIVGMLGVVLVLVSFHTFKTFVSEVEDEDI